MFVMSRLVIFLFVLIFCRSIVSVKDDYDRDQDSIDREIDYIAKHAKKTLVNLADQKNVKGISSLN